MLLEDGDRKVPDLKKVEASLGNTKSPISKQTNNKKTKQRQHQTGDVMNKHVSWESEPWITTVMI